MVIVLSKNNSSNKFPIDVQSKKKEINNFLFCMNITKDNKKINKACMG